jgi:hypothetical protein
LKASRGVVLAPIHHPLHIAQRMATPDILGHGRVDAEGLVQFEKADAVLGCEEVILLWAVGPAQHQEVLHALRLFGEQVIPHFQAREARTAAA